MRTLKCLCYRELTAFRPWITVIIGLKMSKILQKYLTRQDGQCYTTNHINRNHAYRRDNEKTIDLVVTSNDWRWPYVSERLMFDDKVTVAWSWSLLSWISHSQSIRICMLLSKRVDKRFNRVYTARLLITLFTIFKLPSRAGNYQLC